MKFSLSKLNACIRQAIHHSDLHQNNEGFYIGDLESNSCMEAQWVLAMHFLGVKDDPKHPDVIQAILNEQRPDGSWEIYYDAPQGDINTTVECYAALRCAGFDPDSAPLRRARRQIFAYGGLQAVRVFTKYWLALIGEWPWCHTPMLPPEIIFLPRQFPLNIYRFASWARATMLPIALLTARRPVRPFPPDRRLDELFPEGRVRFDYRSPQKFKGLCWENFFIAADYVLNQYNTSGWHPLRANARKRCIRWIVDHQDADGVWGGIQPPMIYSLMALNAEGYACTHPVIAAGLNAFANHWSYRKKGALYICASESPVWDTLLTMLAQLDCDVNPRHSEALLSAFIWIMEQFVIAPGDWQVHVRNVHPGAWAFERANTHYPDVDDTAVALIVLSEMRSSFENTAAIDRAIRLATAWLCGMQYANGGWGAFDKDNNSTLVTRIPFSDFGETLDPPSVDVTAHVVEALGKLGGRQGWDRKHEVVRRASAYIKQEQEADGSWFGRWGVNYIYGTAAVLPALKAIGEDMTAAYIRRAGDWIASHQNPDGGWGESCASYMDDRYRGCGPSTASQTAWALIALLATADRNYDDVLIRGAQWLIACQRNGTWDEPYYTGTGFPGYGVGERTDLKQAAQNLAQGAELSRGFMINYNLYRHYFPLMALGRIRRHFGLHDNENHRL